MKTLNAGRLLAVVGGKALVIPKGGWRAHDFRRHGQALVMTLHRAALITQRKHTAIIARAVAEQFRRQLATVVFRFLRRSGFGRGRSADAPDQKVYGDVFLNAHEDLILQILNEVIAETGAAVTAEILPVVRSTLDQGYARTAALLAQPAHPTVGLQRRALELASRVTNISNTTRVRLRHLLDGAVKERLSVVETAKLIEARMPKIQGSRALTIARTETNAAWREGSIQAFKESSTLTMISVIGCESREEDRWDSPSYAPYLYRGESTCNIEDVPVADVDKLEFHINHTGTMVPSGFIE